MIKIEVTGTDEECQVVLDVLNGAIGDSTNIAIEIETHVEAPPIVAKPLVLIKGGRSSEPVSKKVELPRLQ